ncbi:MAG: 4-(cytidine 5'-diphospho)-2-C-methyl-D-erythritol kinase [Clostridium sp.]|nr:4-(cytidine 5'-diphospho)-2-C-methyl-D-erythritol kinase [Clostridium sp.]
MLIHPNAKINLGLFVTEKRADGYHNLETVFYPIPLRDELEVEERTDASKTETTPADSITTVVVTPDYTLTVSGVPVAGSPEDNLIIKVYRLLKEEFHLPALNIRLHKHIPSGAGMGGGSADAAFMMRLLNERFSLAMSDEDMERRIAPLGADCAFFVRNRPAYATGIGNILKPMDDFSLQGLHLVVVKGDTFISTREAYARITPRPSGVYLPDALRQPVETWRHTLRNDFEESLFPAHPEIAAVKNKLYETGAVYALMSGSGASVFGLFRSRPAGLDAHFAGMFCESFAL